MLVDTERLISAYRVHPNDAKYFVVLVPPTDRYVGNLAQGDIVEVLDGPAGNVFFREKTRTLHPLCDADGEYVILAYIKDAEYDSLKREPS